MSKLLTLFGRMVDKTTLSAEGRILKVLVEKPVLNQLAWFLIEVRENGINIVKKIKIK